MFGISQSAGYAITALTRLEDGCQSVASLKDIAASAQVPPAYLAKLFKKLADAGILVTKRGWTGGTKLARPASRITLLDVVLVIDGDSWTRCCLLGLAECSDQRACPSHEFWKIEQTRIHDYLASLTLADVIAFEHSRKM